MKRTALSLIAGFAAALLFAIALRPATGGPLRAPLQAPDFTHSDANEWINSAPLKLGDLRGKVVFVDFWTFDCWNCYHSFPWLKAMEARLEPEGLQIIGVHSPEFEREKVRDNIVAKVKEFGLTHPVMIDTDFSYWNAMGNRYWPAYYVIDKRGNIRAVFAGETHEGDEQAKQIESLLHELVTEKPGAEQPVERPGSERLESRLRQESAPKKPGSERLESRLRQESASKKPGSERLESRLRQESASKKSGSERLESRLRQESAPKKPGSERPESGQAQSFRSESPSKKSGSERLESRLRQESAPKKPGSERPESGQAQSFRSESPSIMSSASDSQL